MHKNASPWIIKTQAWILCGFLSVMFLAPASYGQSDTAKTDGSVQSETSQAQEDTASKPEGSAYVLRLKGGIPEELPIPGDPRPYASSPYAEQIDKALAFLAFKDRDVNRLYRLVLLDYMQRKYCLHERYGLKSTYAAHRRDESMGDLGNLKRLIEPDFLVDKEVIDGCERVERIVLSALYCDLYPAELSLLDEILATLKEGMNPFTPVLGLSTLWLRDHNCFLNEPQLMLVRNTLSVMFKNHLQEKGLATSMAGQCLALLFELNHPEMVQDEWLQGVAEAQNDEGGWPTAIGTGNQQSSNGMTTTHLVWALLQHAIPDAPKTPMVQSVSAENNK